MLVPRRSDAFNQMLQDLDVNDAAYLKVIQSRIRQRRLELGWTQEYAAEQIGIGLNWYQQLESKQVWRFNPTMLRLLLVARKMKLEPVELFAVPLPEASIKPIKNKKLTK